MTYQLTTNLDLTEFFEQSDFYTGGNVQRLFYYEPSTNTINFGFGINLTSASQSAQLQAQVDQMLAENGVHLSAADWTNIRSVNAELR